MIVEETPLPRRSARRIRVARTKQGRRAAREARFIVLTGLSGSGKSQAIRALEDLGYFCVDNIPTTLIPTLAELVRREGISRVAIVVDIREKNFLAEFREDVSAASEHERAEPGAHLSRSDARDAGAALQRDATAASACARLLGVRKGSRPSAGG